MMYAFALPGRRGRPALKRFYLVAVLALILGLIGCGRSNPEASPDPGPRLLFEKPGATVTDAGVQQDGSGELAAAPQAVAGNVAPTDLPTAIATTVPTPEATATLPAPDLAPLVDPIVENAMQEFGLVGLTLGIRQSETAPFVKAYGRNDTVGSMPADPALVYPIGSLTKQFTAASILQLAEAGTLNLDDPISRFIPGTPNAWAGITVRHLLNHTSGLSDFDAALIASLDKDRAYTVEEVLALIKEAAPVPAFTPGSAFQYSSVGYGLLGATIERVSGLSYGEYLRQHLFGPIGLDASGFDMVYPAGTAQGHAWVAGELQPVAPVHPSISFAAGGVLSTARDLLTWQQALAEGRVVSQGGYASMITPTILADGTEVPYGYGLWIGRGMCQAAVDHSGRMPGYESHLLHCPYDDLGLVVLLNSSPADPGALETLVSRLTASLLNGIP